MNVEKYYSVKVINEQNKTTLVQHEVTKHAELNNLHLVNYVQMWTSSQMQQLF